MYLLDTNVWLERLLQQEKSEDVGNFLDQISVDLLFISDFSLHSIGIILTRLNKSQILIDFVQDLFVDNSIAVLGVQPESIITLVEVMNKLGLDFDDAYQYLVAVQYDLVIISFDSDFDRTPRPRKTPAEILST